MTVQPPIRSSNPLLPLRGSDNFSWKMFENFAEQLVLAVTGVQPIHFGRIGEKQSGIDAYVDLERDARWTFQFRQVEDLDVASAKTIVRNTDFEGQRHFVFVACEVGTKVRRYFDSLPDWEIWDVRDISLYVRTMPTEAGRRLIYQFFGNAWVGNFFEGSSIASLVSAEVYFAPQGRAEFLRHDLSLAGRERQLTEFREFIASDSSIALISGRGGIGKSRFLRELPSLRGEFEMRFATSVALTPEAVADLPLCPTIIVIDDAHERNDIAIALEIARQRPITTRVVIATRPHTLDLIRTVVSRHGLNREDIRELTPLDELTREQTKGIIAEVLGPNHDDAVTALTHRVSDSPILAVVGARLMQTKGLNLLALANDEDVRFTVFSRYRDDILGKTASVDQTLARNLLALVASLGPLSISDRRTVATSCAFLEIHEDEFLRAVDDLEAIGILRRRGSGVRVTPEVLADFILEEACMTRSGKETGYASRVFQQFSGVAGTRLLRNLGFVDWQISNSPGRISILDTVWASLLAEFRDSDLSRRYEILAMVEGAALFQPEKALRVVEYVISDADQSQDLDSQRNSYGSTVLEHLPAILRAIAQHPEYVARATRLLWELGRDDLRPLTSSPAHGFSILCKLAKPRRLLSSEHRSFVISAVSSWLQDSDIHDHHHSLLDIMQAALMRQTMETWSESAGSFHTRACTVNPEDGVETRAAATSVVLECSQHARVDVVYRAAKVLIEQAKPMYSGMLGQVVTSDQQAAWKDERLTVLSELDRIASKTSEPLLALEIVKAVEQLRHYESNKEIKGFCALTVERISARSDLADVEILVDSWGHRDRFDKRARAINSKLADKWHQKRLARMASHFVRGYTPEAFITFFNETALRCHNLGISFAPQALLQHVVRQHPEYGIALVGRLLNEVNGPLADHIQTLLACLPMQEALPLALKALSTKRPELARATAALLSVDAPWSSSQLDLYRTLISHEDPSVRAATLRSLRWAAKHNLALILESLQRLDIRGDPAVAQALAELFNKHNIPVSEMRQPILLSLVKQLVDIPEISGYRLEDFVSEALTIAPKATIDMLLGRVERKGFHESLEGRAIPYNLRIDLKRLSAHPDYCAVLRKVRDACRMPSIWASHYIPQLWREIADFRSPTTLAVLTEWFDSGDPEQIEAGAKLLSDVHENFVFDQFDHVVKILELAWTCGSQCYENVEAYLFMPGITSRQGTHGEPFPQDTALMANAESAMRRLTPHTAAWRFFERLQKHALSNIERKRVRDEDLQERFLD